jgi:hypothetical protein
MFWTDTAIFEPINSRSLQSVFGVSHEIRLGLAHSRRNFQGFQPLLQAYFSAIRLRTTIIIHALTLLQFGQ